MHILAALHASELLRSPEIWKRLSNYETLIVLKTVSIRSVTAGHKGEPRMKEVWTIV